MTLNREAGSEPLGQFTVPFQGTLYSGAIHTVPMDALYLSNNVFIRKGLLCIRPGLAPLVGSNFAEPILGGVMVVSPTEKRLLAVAQHYLYERGVDDTAWSGSAAFLNDTSFTVNDRTMVDVAYLETTGASVAIIASAGRQLKQWNSLDRSISTLTAAGGSAVIPSASSVCIAARRVVCLVPPHTLTWSKTFQVNNYNPLAVYKIAQTNDAGICVRSISNLSFALYKERSIYPARAQSGNDEVAFTFAEPIKVEGPASLHAVVDVGGSHIYMTKNGRIASFDGVSYPQWLADGLWLYLQDDIDPNFTFKIFGFYDYRLNCVIFCYPKVGAAGAVTGMLVINLPMIGNNTTPASFLGQTMIPVTYAYESRFDGQIDQTVLFGGSGLDFKAYTLNEHYRYDDNIPFPFSHQSGLMPMPEGKHAYVNVEVLAQRGVGYGTAVIEPVFSDGLEDADGYIPSLHGQVINLEENPVRHYVGFGKQGRFFGVKYSGLSTARFQYAGTVVHRRSTV